MGILTINNNLEKLFGTRDMYFTIEAVTSGSLSFGISQWWNKELYCAKNNEDWELLKYDGENYNKEFLLEVGDKLHFKCNYNRPIVFSEITTLNISSFNIMGYLSSLWKSDNCLNDNTLSEMYGLAHSFSEMGVVDASKLILPNNTEYGCYNSMFQNCSSLTNAPELPATILAESCYDSMFMGCSSLTAAPELPATVLADLCYTNMFYNCTSLTTAPELPATTLAAACYCGMFGKCTSLTTAPELPATTLANRCYDGMFNQTNLLPDCSNIDFSSETVVASGGLQGLFSYTKVTDADLMRILPINESTDKYWLPCTTLNTNCYSGMFQGCTSLEKAPELPATTLANRCYQNMFNGCTNLNYIKAMFTTTPSSSYTSNWVKNVAANGTFIKSASASWTTTGVNGIPTGWTVETA